MKKTFIILLIFISSILLGCSKDKETTKYNIVSTSFPGYDFARAIIKDVDDISVKMLLKPGSETHDFEPTPQDIIDIQNSDIFIYVGGESDSWIDNVLNDIDTGKTKIIKLMDLAKIYEEETTEGMEQKEDSEEEIEYDEHVWTSPINAIKMVNKIKEEIINIDSNNKELYENNANDYIQKLTNIDIEIRNILDSSKRKEVVFGDRFPLRYFVEEYNITYHAAFPGCAHETEASAKTIAYLINYVKNNDIPVIFYVELSNGKIADTIAKETNAKTMEFNSMHNITKDDFDKGLTYIDYMKKNIEALKVALN